MNFPDKTQVEAVRLYEACLEVLVQPTMFSDEAVSAVIERLRHGHVSNAPLERERAAKLASLLEDILQGTDL